MIQNINMDKITENYNILFVCIDSLRFDVAYEEEKSGGTPVLNKYGNWRKCQAPGNFTYPSHQAMFAGFFPVDEEINEMKKREKLFFSADTGIGRKAPEGTFLFSQPTWVQELANIGYETYCIGGLSFFDKRTKLGSVMPSYFKYSYWHPSFGCKVKDSTKNQVDFALKKLSEADNSKKIMMYINISAVHYPNYFYGKDEKKDSVETHRLALRYVDSQLGRLFDGFAKKGNTFVICCSDHGTCYGEDGMWYHGINHPIVNIVPYKHFIIEENTKDTIWPYIQYMYSYPHKTAYRNLSGINLKDWLHCLKGSNNSLYFHIPFCQYKCGYCNLFSVAGMEDNISFMQEYICTMEKHARQIAEAMPDGIFFNEMSIGGGTPLILPIHLLAQVFDIAERHFGIKPGIVPVSVETSPNQTEDEKLQLLKKHGVSRISIGIQSFNKTELEKLRRFHSPECAIKALGNIKAVGFPCLNIDIIYGIPGQTKDTLLQSLKQAVFFEPEELFVYPLYVKKGTGLYKTGIKPSPDTMELYICARDFLMSNGYMQKSMRCFQRTGSACIQENYSALCGFNNTVSTGCGGRSYIGNLHYCTPYTIEYTGCLKSLSDYIKQEDFLTVKHGFILSKDEQKRRYAVKHILYGSGILRKDYKEHFGSDAEQDFPVIKEWCRQGYANIDDNFISLSKDGIALSDYLGVAFISEDVREKMENWKPCII
ncbi:MAG TPA: coproporphyrinogen III oxidase family protein [Lachnospiraceae bacterium]|nr:coproporphyrinogen III oxidase family protein [Lachnospiraceae bacterium]